MIQQVRDVEYEIINWLVPKAQASALAQLIHEALPGLTSLTLCCFWHVDFLRELASAAPPLLLQAISIVGILDAEESEVIGRFTSLRKVCFEGEMYGMAGFACLPHLGVLLCKDPFFDADDEGLSEVLRCCTRFRELQLPCLPRGWHLQSSSLSCLTLRGVECHDRLNPAGLPHLQSLSVRTLYIYADLEAEGLTRAVGAAAPASPPPSLIVHLGCVEYGVNRDAVEVLLVAHGWQPMWEGSDEPGCISFGPSQQRAAAGALLWRVLTLPS